MTILVLSGLSLAALCVAVVRREVDVYWHPVLWVAVGLFGWACVSIPCPLACRHELNFPLCFVCRTLFR